jgi:hypothetical protein
MKRVLVAGVVVALVLMATVPPAAASWLQGSAAAPTGDTSTLNGVSCLSPNHCEAVGDFQDNSGTFAMAEGQSGAIWTIQTTSDPAGSTEVSLVAVSCFTATSCMATGTFTTSSSDLAFAEQWTGSSWSAENVINPSGANSVELSSIACKALTSCIAVGSSIKSAKSQLLAERWNGSTWSTMTAPKPHGASTAGFSGVSCTSTSACTAVGWSLSGSTTTTLAERWNGTTWSIETTPNPASSTFSELLSVSCTTAKACEASGTGFGEEWNGSSWTLQTFPKLEGSTSGPPTLYGVSCFTSVDCFAVGGYFDDGVLTFAAEGWNGTHWVVQNVPLSTSSVSSDLNDVSCTRANACTAVGYYQDPDNGEQALGEVFQLQWQLQFLPDPNGAIASGMQAVSCATGKLCMSVGNYEASGSTFDSLGERWDGSEWVSQAMPNPATTYLAGVACPTSTFCIAVGDSAVNGTLLSRAQVWKGLTWSNQTIPNPTGATRSYLTSISCRTALVCTAVGSYTKGSRQDTLVERWNGTAWSVQSSPNRSGVHTSVLNAVSCATKTTCVAVGYDLSPSYTMLAEVWNGTTWSIKTTALPSGGKDGDLNSVSCPSATVCETMGDYYNGTDTVSLDQAWDGTSFVSEAAAGVGGAVTTDLVGVSCASTTVCNAVGSYRKGGGTFIPLAETFNGTEWMVTPLETISSEGETALVSDSCYSTTGCIGVGYYTDSSETQNLLAEQYN